MIITDPTITNFHNFSWGKCNALHSTPSKISSLRASILNGTSHIKKKEIFDFLKRLEILDNTLNSYKPSLIRRLWDLITGQKYKRNWLKRTLPKVIEAVDALKIEICEQDPKYIDDITKKLVESKLKLVNKATKHFNSIRQYSISYYTATKVETYFNSLRDKLNSGINVQIPRWFHSTKSDKISWIVRDKLLKMYSAPRGNGVFVASHEEPFYGPITFAIGDDFFRNTGGHCFPSLFTDTYPTYGHYSLWACVYKDIPISSKTIAFVIDDNLGPETKKLEKEGISVLTHDVSNQIYHIFEAVTEERELSTKWTRSTLNWTWSNQLAQNMKNVFSLPAI